MSATQFNSIQCISSIAVVFEMTNSNKSVFIDRNTSHIKHGWQENRMIMEYNACVSCALIGHNFLTVLQDTVAPITQTQR